MVTLAIAIRPVAELGDVSTRFKRITPKRLRADTFLLYNDKHMRETFSEVGLKAWLSNLIILVEESIVPSGCFNMDFHCLELILRTIHFCRTEECYANKQVRDPVSLFGVGWSGSFEI